MPAIIAASNPYAALNILAVVCFCIVGFAIMFAPLYIWKWTKRISQQMDKLQSFLERESLARKRAANVQIDIRDMLASICEAMEATEATE